MAYDRRNLNLYHRGGGGGGGISSSYRNKALLIVAATALYTAFLYNSGMLYFFRWYIIRHVFVGFVILYIVIRLLLFYYIFCYVVISSILA